ncbi:MAG TPA: circularly permuted type 2 ATP-grasp protein, partial [Roseomonas sp.]
MEALTALAPARDEMANGHGGLRAHWQDLLGTLVGLGPDALAERGAMLDRLFAEEGVTALLPGAGAGAWRCDPVPLPIPAGEFAALEAGLAQRASVIEAMLADLYGPQELLARGVVPPGLVFPNPAFLRPCHGMPQQSHLQLYAADLIRGPDGQWRVLADRTNAPHGMAYALENRRALSRIVPEIFRARHLRRMRPFFDTWQAELQRLAPGGDGNPGLALLSPGPRNAFWFEHVVLARELSCTLVEGGDLTARDGAVFLKTLGGLRRVDVLLRRQDGRGLDPLELDAGDGLAQGVSGLLDAVRAGSLVIANAPGSDMAEAPGLAAFLPAVAAHLGAGPLRLASVPTLWLGQPDALRAVARDPAQWLLRPALDGVAPPVPLADLAPAAREALLQRAAASPREHAASLALAPSVAPCIGPDGFEPRPIVLRLFLVRRGDGWVALQGGLARALAPADALAGRLPRQALAKDVWVATEDSGEIQGPAAFRVPALPIRRPTGELPSRAADNFFWFGRYLERLESAARLLRSVIARLERASLSPREMASLQKLAACL